MPRSGAKRAFGFLKLAGQDHDVLNSLFAMKEGIHPKVYPVLYVDGSHEWQGIGTATTGTTRVVDGVEHYVVNLEISAYSHPFYTGQKRLVDTAGRVEKFMRRYGNQMQKK